MNKKLRIGLLIDDYLIPAWTYKMLEIILASEHSEIVLIVKKKMTVKEKQSKFKSIWEQRDMLLFYVLQILDTKQAQSSPDAFEIKDFRKLVTCPEIEVLPKETKYSDTVFQDDVDKIIQHNVDVFIRLGFRILRGNILNSCKYGVWSFHHGDNTVNRGGPAGVWEVMQNWDETGVILQILTEDLDGGIKLSESFSTTDKFSFGRNKNNYYWKALSMIPRKLNELYQLGEKEFFQKLHENNSPYFYYNQLFTTPSTQVSFKFLSRFLLQKMKLKVESLFYFEQWILLFKLEKQNKMATSFFRFKKILPPKDRFWADPFVIEKNGTYYIFIEELIYSEDKGKIAVIEMDKNGNYTKPEIVLEKDYHLSYPFLYEENEELYMIPETASHKTIELYKCIDFPSKWELCEVLMENVSAVDTTITKKDNKYWMFCNIKEHAGANSSEELFLFYSDGLLNTNWTSHPDNPIVSDVKKSRPAGAIFTANNKLYRPSQNCAKRYGHGMQINEIEELTETAYSERSIQPIYPNWEKDILGTHTLNNYGGLTVIDALLKRRK